MVLGSTAGLAYFAAVESRVQMADDDVAAAIASLPSELTVSSDVRKGLPAEEIIRSSHDVDLLVLGSHRRGPLGRALLGSVSDAVVRAAACPVLVVPSVVVAKGVAQPASDTLAGA